VEQTHAAAGELPMKIRRSGTLLCREVALYLLVLGPISANAQLLGPEFQVNSFTTLAQHRPAVAVDASGNFVVVWADAAQESVLNYGIYGQGFTPAGTLGTEFHVNTFTTGLQQNPAVAASGTNNFLVV